MVAKAGTAAEFTLSAFCSLSFTYAVLSPTLYTLIPNILAVLFASLNFCSIALPVQMYEFNLTLISIVRDEQTDKLAVYKYKQP